MQQWDRIVRENARNVLSAAQCILGNLADAEDVSQEVFAEAFQKFGEKGEQNWAGLLRRLAVCRAIDVLRRAKRPEVLPDAIDNRTVVSPLGAAIAQEQRQQLRVAISKLPNQQSEVFCLVIFEQLSREEVADQLGISKGAVSTSLSKARSTLETVFCTQDKGKLA